MMIWTLTTTWAPTTTSPNKMGRVLRHARRARPNSFQENSRHDYTAGGKCSCDSAQIAVLAPVALDCGGWSEAQKEALLLRTLSTRWPAGYRRRLRAAWHLRRRGGRVQRKAGRVCRPC